MKEVQRRSTSNYLGTSTVLLWISSDQRGRRNREEMDPIGSRGRGQLSRPRAKEDRTIGHVALIVRWRSCIGRPRILVDLCFRHDSHSCTKQRLRRRNLQNQARAPSSWSRIDVVSLSTSPRDHVDVDHLDPPPSDMGRSQSRAFAG